ncbi:MAG: Sporulation protein YtfJ [Evtepia sp.]|jgi:sporulation protein YtfJ|nr:Sporulation protein YtfJ [Evtepia sp.]
MDKNHPINEMMATTIQKVRDLVDANTIIGQPIVAGDITLIPVSKLSFGFGTGGSEFAVKNQKPEQDNAFGGGGGAGVKITPVAFLTVHGESVKLLPMTAPADTTMDRIVELVPDLVDKVADFFEKKPKDSKDKM